MFFSRKLATSPAVGFGIGSSQTKLVKWSRYTKITVFPNFVYGHGTMKSMYNRFAGCFADLAYFAIIYGFLYADHHVGPVIELPYSCQCFMESPMTCCTSMIRRYSVEALTVPKVYTFDLP